MRRTFVRRFACAVLYGFGFALVWIGCFKSSSTNAPASDATTCTPADASIQAVLTNDAGSFACNSCIAASCTTAAGACAAQCTCNDTALTALSCIEGLGSNASLAGEIMCLAPLANSSDPTLQNFGSCIQTHCASPCTGASGSSDAGGGCDAADANLTALLQAGTGACDSCLQSNCGAVTGACAGDCTCNAEAVSALECLANLGANASVAQVAACLAPLAGTAADSGLGMVGTCLETNCQAQCIGGTSDGGAEGGVEGGPEAGPEGGPGMPEGGPSDAGLGGGFEGGWQCASETDCPGVDAGYGACCLTGGVGVCSPIKPSSIDFCEAGVPLCSNASYAVGGGYCYANNEGTYGPCAALDASVQRYDASVPLYWCSF